MYNTTLNKGKKRDDIFTPPAIANRIYEIIQESELNPKTILDPAIGNCNLIEPFLDSGCRIIGIDIVKYFRTELIDQFILARYERLEKKQSSYIYKGRKFNLTQPDLVVINPPFNGEKDKKFYPEIFLRKTFELFGENQPIVLITPMGLRLNIRVDGARYQWMKQNNIRITSILSLPLNAFKGVLFHSEVLFFNILGVEPHYWL
jgi:hypothetical protein